MSYLVLARKYRPQTFEEVVGQEHVTHTLANAFSRGRVHHAFLFCGPRGVGKTTAARILARALCCEKGPSAVPCGTCDACRTITSGTAVDYFEIDGASNNSVDDVRELRDGVRYQPAQLRRKIYVIDEVHMLSTAAFNALLKTLEEPPPHVTFVFATTEVHKIPVTILSRCQRYDFKLVSTARLATHLERILGAEGIAIDAGARLLIAREAGGSVRDMLSLADQVIAYVGEEAITEPRVAEVLGVADRALLAELARSVLGGDTRSALLAVDAAAGRGVDLAHLARAFLGTLRDLAIVQSVADPAALPAGLIEVTSDELAGLVAQAKTVSKPQLLAQFDRFARACEEMARSQSPRLVLELALIAMTESEPLLPIAELVERLDQLEKRLGRGGGTAPAGPRSSGPGARSASPVVPVASTPVGAPVGVRKGPAGRPDDPAAEWERLVTGLEQRSITLAGVYAHAQLLGWDERGVEIGFAAQSLQGSLGGDPENVASLKRFLNEQTGAPLDVRIRVIAAGQTAASGAMPSVAEAEGARKRTDRDKREEEARAHPATLAVMETFGATIKEIKVDG